jgi:dihydrofolate reductase
MTTTTPPVEGSEGPGFFRVARWVIGAMEWRERQGAAGAYVMGRRMFDGGEIPWGETPPFRAPVFVVTHRHREVLARQPRAGHP